MLPEDQIDRWLRLFKFYTFCLKKTLNDAICDKRNVYCSARPVPIQDIFMEKDVKIGTNGLFISFYSGCSFRQQFCLRHYFMLLFI